MNKRNPSYDFLLDEGEDVNGNLLSNDEEAVLSTITEKFLEHKELKGLSPATLDQYEEVLGYFIDYLDDDVFVEDVTENMIRHYMRDMYDNGIEITTVGIRFRVLRAFFNWITDKGLIEEAPTDGIEEPKTPNQFPYVLDEDQVKKLVEVTEDRLDRWSGIRNRTLVLLMLDVGLRSEEVRTVQLSNLNINDRSLKVHGKGGKDRKVYFGQNSQEWLKHWEKVRSDIDANVNTDTIFIDLNGHQIKQRNLNRIITRLQKRAGLEDAKVSPHVLRHTAATLAVKNGLDVHSLQEMMGHSQLQTSMRYVHMTGKRLKEATEDTSPMDSI